jgi:hypothetical protein
VVLVEELVVGFVETYHVRVMKLWRIGEQSAARVGLRPRARIT